MKFSVVIPIYNVGEFVRFAFDSLLNQTYANWEAICIDDGSTDESAHIVEEYVGKDSRFKMLRQKNSGTVIARNRGVAATTGDYIVFLDPDDELNPDAMEVLRRNLFSNRVDILQYGVEIIESFKRTPLQVAASERYFNPPCVSINGEGLLLAIYRDRKIGWNLIFRVVLGSLARAAFGEIPDINSINETDAFAMFYIASHAKSFAQIPDRLYRYRYGVGVSTKKTYGFAEYERTLGKIPCARALLDYARRHAKLNPSIVECAQYAAMRMISNSWASAFGRLQRKQERIAALRLLQKKTEATLFVCAMSYKYQTEKDIPQAIREMECLPTVINYIKPVGKIRAIGFYYFRISQGGVQRVISLLIERFVAAGYNVVLFLDEPVTKECYQIPSGVEIVYLPSPLTAKRLPWMRIQAFSSALKQHPVDVMYSHAYVSPSLIWDILVCKMVAHIPFVLHQHSVFVGMLYSQTEEANRKFFYLPYLHRWCDAVVCLSTADCTYERANGVRSVYFPNPVAPGLVSELENPWHGQPHHIVWVSRMSWEKRPTDALTIFKMVREKISDVTMTMVGGGDEKTIRVLQDEIAKNRLGECVTLTGGLSDVFPEYAKASVFLTTSCIEGFPMASLEALCFGLPIVAYEMPHLELYKGNEAVIQVPQGDARAAADELVRVLNLKNIGELRETAKCFVRQFSAFDVVAAWRKHLLPLMGGRGVVCGKHTKSNFPEMLNVYTKGVNRAIDCLWKKVGALNAITAELKKKHDAGSQSHDLARALSRFIPSWRIDCKYKNDEIGAVNAVNCTKDVSVSHPAGLNDDKNGGCCIAGSAIVGEVVLKSKGKGKCVLVCRGQDVRSKNNNVQVPFYVNYKSIKVGGHELLSRLESVTSSNNHKITVCVGSSEEVRIAVETKPHVYERAVLRDMLLKAKLPVEVTGKNVDQILDAPEMAAFLLRPQEEFARALATWCVDAHYVEKELGALEMVKASECVRSEQADWMKTKAGVFRRVTCTKFGGVMSFKSKGAGKVKIALHGQERYAVADEKTRMLVPVDFVSLKVRGKELLGARTVVDSAAHSAWFTIDVKAGETVEIVVETAPHVYRREELKELMLKVKWPVVVPAQSVDAWLDDLVLKSFIAVPSDLKTIEKHKLQIAKLQAELKRGEAQKSHDAPGGAASDRLRRPEAFVSSLLTWSLDTHYVEKEIGVFEVVTASDGVRVERESWMKTKEKVFQRLTCAKFGATVAFKSKGAGKVNIALLGQDLRAAADGKTRMLVPVDFVSVKVRGKEVLLGRTVVDRAHPAWFTIDVKADETVEIVVETAPHAFKREELKELMLKVKWPVAVPPQSVDAWLDDLVLKSFIAVPIDLKSAEKSRKDSAAQKNQIENQRLQIAKLLDELKKGEDRESEILKSQTTLKRSEILPTASRRSQKEARRVAALERRADENARRAEEMLARLQEANAHAEAEKKKVEELEQRLAAAQQVAAREKRKTEAKAQEVAELKSSEAYTVGMSLTKPARAIKRALTGKK